MLGFCNNVNHNEKKLAKPVNKIIMPFMEILDKLCL